MCKIINFREYKRRIAMKKAVQVKAEEPIARKSREKDLVTAEWCEEFIRKGWGLSKLIGHVIEQIGCIHCREAREDYVFEEIKKDTAYCQMYPEVQNKRLRAPLWVKIKGEWYFVEVCTDSVSHSYLSDKRVELGNYDVKGFIVDLYGLNKKKLKSMLAENNIAGAAEEIRKKYKEGSHAMWNNLGCRTSVSFGRKKSQRDCTYKLAELQPHRYAIVEGTEVKTGDKHLVLLCGSINVKGFANYFKEKYKDAGIPLLFGHWEAAIENWKSCIRKQEKLYRQPMTE